MLRRSITPSLSHDTTRSCQATALKLRRSICKRDGGISFRTCKAWHQEALRQGKMGVFSSQDTGFHIDGTNQELELDQSSSSTIPRSGGPPRQQSALQAPFSTSEIFPIWHEGCMRRSSHQCGSVRRIWESGFPTTMATKTARGQP